MQYPLHRGSTWRLFVFLLIAAVTPMLSAATYYVSAATGNDGRTAAQVQNPATPWRTLTRALGDAAVGSGDTVSVAAGTYDAALGETYPLALKNGVALDGDARLSLIRPPGGTSAFVNVNTPLNALTSLSGFDLANAASGLPQPLIVFGPVSSTQSPRIDDNSFTGGTNVDEGDAGILIAGTMQGGTFNGTISNNTFAGFVPNVAGPLGDLEAAGIVAREQPAGVPVADEISPTIRGNTFNANRVGISVRESYTPGSPDAVGAMRPIVEGNTFSTNHIDQLYFYSGSVVGTFAPTISANQSTSPASASIVFFPLAGTLSRRRAPDRVAIEGQHDPAKAFIRQMRAGLASYLPSAKIKADGVGALATNRVFSPVITFNTVTGAGVGAVFVTQNFTDGESLAINLTLEDNAFSGSPNGFHVELVVPAETAEVADAVSVARNTVTGAPGGTSGYAFGNSVRIVGTPVLPPAGSARGIGSDAVIAVAANNVQIRNNRITQMPEAGLGLGSDNYSTLAFAVECNFITGNGGAAIWQTSQTDPNADLGGGGRSNGNNDLSGNSTTATGAFDLINLDPDPMTARFNFWASATPDVRISDDDEGTGGAVDFSSFLAAAPATCLPTADLQLVKNGPATAGPGAIVYTLTVTNAGPGTATNVTVTDTLPAGTTFVSATAGCALQPGNIVVCTTASLASAGVAVFNITVSAPATPAVLVNSATVSADAVDPVPANNADTASTTIIVQDAADITAVPTLSEWGIAIMALLLIGCSLWLIGRNSLAG